MKIVDLKIVNDYIQCPYCETNFKNKTLFSKHILDNYKLTVQYFSKQINNDKNGVYQVDFRS